MRRLPLPWVNGLKPVWQAARGFVEMDPKRVSASEQTKPWGLCVVCGLELGRVRVMGRFRGTDRLAGVMLTDGPAGHPRCIALAARHCPHLRSLAGLDEPLRNGAEHDRVVAYVYDGPGPPSLAVPKGRGSGLPRVVHPSARKLTPEDLRALAKTDPLGHGLKTCA
jgi:hypothetical protein